VKYLAIFLIWSSSLIKSQTRRHGLKFTKTLQCLLLGFAIYINFQPETRDNIAEIHSADEKVDDLGNASREKQVVPTSQVTMTCTQTTCNQRYLNS